jgi:uncharacterized protein (TIGR03790 family)
MTRPWSAGVAPFALAALSFVCSGTAFGQSPENVAVVVNENSAASQVIAQDYIKKRGIPDANVIRLHAPVDETVDRSTYIGAIEQPIAASLARGALQDRILYIVLTKGVPLRIAGSLGQEGTMASVDSELTLLYRKMTGQSAPVSGHVPNPYFLGQRAIGDAQRFSHRDYDIYLVTRIDAFTVEEAQMLVDLALKPSTAGRVVIDQRDAVTAHAGEELLAKTAQAVREIDSPDRVLLETTPKPASTADQVVGYASWGSTDPQLRGRFVGLRFAPGAIAATLAGADARTFQAPPPDWVPMKDPSNRSTWFGGSPQSLIGDLIREGVTGIAGSVAEPFLQGVVRPDVVFPAYLSGFNLAESFYIAMPFLSWETVVIGDPLCQPFAKKPLPRGDLEPALDSSTELPSFFGERKLRTATAASGGDPKVISLVIRAEARIDRGDRAGGRALLAQAAAAAPTVPGLHLQLASLDEAIGDYQAAIAGYRRVLELQPQNTLALNNLAYALAVHENNAADAKPLAERAVQLSNRNATVVDTLGWIDYLLGDTAAAVSQLADAARRAPNNADIRLHAAFAYAAAGDMANANMHLSEAIRRNPALEHRSDVEDLRKRLSRPPSR